MNISWKWIAFVTGLSLSVDLAEGVVPKTAAQGSKTVIGLSLPLTTYPVFVAGLRGAQQAAEALGVELVPINGQWAASKQAKDIDDLVARHVDGIVVWPIPPHMGSLAPNLEAGVAAGIPFASVSMPISSDKGLVFVTADDPDGGRQLGQFVVEKLHGRGSVLMLEGPPGFATEKKKAFEEVLAKSKVTILASENGGIDRGVAQLVMTELIQRYPRFDGVVSLNDEMMIGAITAMREAGIDPSRKVTVSSDAIPEAISLVRKGELSATLDPLFDQQAGQALRYLVDYIRDRVKAPGNVVSIRGKLVTKATVPGL